MAKLKEGWMVVHKNKAFHIMYNIVDATDLDKSKPDNKFNYYTMFVAKVWPQVLKDITGERSTGMLYVLAGKGFDSELECKNWAHEQWRDKYEQEWYPEFSINLKKELKEAYIKSTKLNFLTLN